ncbi:MAG: ABC transporter ATP-binding protein [Alsobacter sp.]
MPETSDVALTVRDLRVNFYSEDRCSRVLDGVSFSLRRGRTLCVVGESGCGKSVTASAITRLLPAWSRIEGGEIILHRETGPLRLDHLESNGPEMRSIRGGEIGLVFQDPLTALNPVYTAGFQLVEMLRYHKKMGLRAMRAAAVDLLRRMGMPAPERRVENYPHELSGGMRQRVIIGMATACAPKILIADEPTTALDVTVQAQILDLLDGLRESHGTALMLITHDIGVAVERGDEIAVMYMGNIVEAGSVADVIGKPAHPYTRALLACLPRLGNGKSQSLRAIPGSPPHAWERGEGCAFANRCSDREHRCVAMPPPVSVGQAHMARCWKHVPEACNVRDL